MSCSKYIMLIEMVKNNPGLLILKILSKAKKCHLYF